MYPKLDLALKALAYDQGAYNRLKENRFALLSEAGYDIAAMEAKLAPLSDSDLETLACGEHTEMNDLVSRYDLQDVNAMLEEIFHGPAFECVFRPYR